MRPVGEVRHAMRQAAGKLHAERDGATWRDMAVCARVGFKAAQRAAENMERAGELVVVGHDKRAHSRRWMKLYSPSPAANFATATTDAGLAGVVHSWPRA